MRDRIRKILLKLLYVFPYRISVCSSLEYLKLQGLKIGKNFSMQQGCIIDDSHCWMISIGDNVTLAPNVHILAHDASTKRLLGYTIVAPVQIGNDVFIGAGSIILPGVTIGDHVIVGAGSIVTKPIPDNCVFAGGKIIKSYQEFEKEKRQQFHNAEITGRVFDEKYTISGGIQQTQKEKMVSRGGGFVV